MKIGICKTKFGKDSEAVYRAWDFALMQKGDHPVYCRNLDELNFQKPDALLMVSYPQFDNRAKRICDEHEKFKVTDDIKSSPENVFRLDILKWAKDNNKRIIIIDTGLLKSTRNRDGDLKNYFQVGLDHIKGLGYYYNTYMPSDRWEKLELNILPWRTAETTQNVLIWGQVRFGIGSQHIDIYSWYRHILSWMKENRKNAFYVEHPNMAEPWNSSKFKIKTLQQKEKWNKGIQAAVGFGSNAIVECILNGIPTIVYSKLSPAYDFCSNQIEELDNVKKFEREQWFYDLAYSQWSVQEMYDGLPLKHLKPHLMSGYKGI